MNKTIFSRGLALILLLGILLSLAACGSKAVPTNPSDPAVETQDPGTQPESEKPTSAGKTPSPLVIGKAEAADLMENYKAEAVPEKAADEAFRADMLRFSSELFREVYGRESQSKTLLVSPFSVMTALAMTANGAQGKTLSEMEAALAGKGLTLEDLNAYLHSYLTALPSSEDASFAFANSIWFRDMEGFSVKTDFLQKNVNYYGAGVFKAPFDQTTVRDINQWVAANTHELIPSLLDSLDEEARMVLINALVFEAKWADPFDSEFDVRDGIFTPLSGEPQTVPMMYGRVWDYISGDDCTGFMKSYAGDKYRFVALLPDQNISLDDFVRSLTAEKLSALLSDPVSIKTIIMLPKFSYDYKTSLVTALEALGIRQAFTESAQFGGISDSPLTIGSVIHKTHIDVDNEGTKAAAVTAVIVEATAMPGPEEIRKVYLDRPFVYLIIDSETSLPLFIGTLTEIGR